MNAGYRAVFTTPPSSVETLWIGYVDVTVRADSEGGVGRGRGASGTVHSVLRRGDCALNRSGLSGVVDNDDSVRILGRLVRYWDGAFHYKAIGAWRQAEVVNAELGDADRLSSVQAYSGLRTDCCAVIRPA